MRVNNFANGQWKIRNQTRLIKYIIKVTINSCVDKYHVLNIRFWYKANAQFFQKAAESNNKLECSLKIRMAD